MNNDDIITNMLKILNENFEEQKKIYEESVKKIQDLCPHNILDDGYRMCNKPKCLICGKLVDKNYIHEKEK